MSSLRDLRPTGITLGGVSVGGGTGGSRSGLTFTLP